MKKTIAMVMLLGSIAFGADSFKESVLKGYYEAEGYSAPGQTRFAAMISAKVDAQRRLVELIKGAKITSQTTIAKGMLQNDIMVSKVNGIIQGAKMTAREFDNSSGTAMVRLKIGYKELLKTGIQDEEFKDAFFDMAQTTESEYAIPTVIDVASKELDEYDLTASYDGLIIDATSTNMEPAYINRIFSSGKIVYDPTKVPQQVIVERGLASYTVDINKAKAILGTYGVKNPLIVKATSTTKLKSDVNIEQEIASLVVANNNKNGFLESAKIVFILK
ncbi:hypothetical protein [Sulfurimonas sp.]|uniref:hypothetical protein n=1 Tax=Sulfurimonas sp. TaxID=2022749 RepID=UPI003D0FDC31